MYLRHWVEFYVPFSSTRKRMMDGDTIDVLNHKTKEDVTREVLISILSEQSVPGDELFTENLMLMIIIISLTTMYSKLIGR